ncbi:hypothetical protein BDZ85DRAFT_258120 [Elsinoe ampelina]|uniref:Uncharacterized protein n=1 Tax=Elsinoe ampelina TaxID=302913 RepID=A0A6A6GJI2_9PEZI|nr:hypothetical protein BDZ85DRAFT_258120 [Elsinoe ampelina]
MTKDDSATSRWRFKIAIVCALPLEADAVLKILDHVERNGDTHGRAHGDTNTYSFGRIGGQDVVLVHLPDIGMSGAARASANLKMSFPAVELALVTGICGGIPSTASPATEIFLGDLVTSTGLVQHDFGRQYPSGLQRKTGVEDVLGKPSVQLRGFLSRLRTETHTKQLELDIKHITGMHISMSSGTPAPDILYKSDYLHKHRYATKGSCLCSDGLDQVCDDALNISCDVLGCSTEDSCQRTRPPGVNGTPVSPTVHFGLVGSGNVVMKSGVHRDAIARNGPLIALEMEAAGIWDTFNSCLVVKAVCDYADSHKHKSWQKYAAMVAAAGTKFIISQWQSSSVDTLQRTSDSLACATINRLIYPVTSLKIDTTRTESINEYWSIPRSVNRLFTGRTTILDKLEQVLKQHLEDPQPREPCSVVITGMGGQGKSELCLKIAHDLREKFWGIFWVDVSSEEQAKSDFIAVADLIGRSATSIEQVKRFLSNEKRPWLLILDNADDVEWDYECYMPSGTNARTIITSRNVECAGLASQNGHLPLDGLGVEDAEELLYRATKLPSQLRQQHQSDVNGICKVLGYHALAINQAGAFIAKGLCRIAEYAGLFEKQRSRLLKYHPTQGRSRYGNVYSTFEVAAKVLETTKTTEAEDALLLLSLLTVYNWIDLPLDMFKAARQSQLSRVDCDDWQGVDNESTSDYMDVLHLPEARSLDMFDEEADTESPDGLRLQLAVSLLESFALITRTLVNERACISMHPLVHAWAQSRLPSSEHLQRWKRGATVLALAARADLWEGDLRLLQPHILYLADREILIKVPPDQVNETMVVFAHLVNLLDILRNDRLCIELLEAMFDKLDLSITDPTTTWWPLYRLYAISLRRNGLYRFSADVLAAVIRTRTTGSDMVPTSAMLNLRLEYCRSLSWDGNYKEALQQLQLLYTLCRDYAGPDSADLLSVEHELGSAFRRCGYPLPAIPTLAHALAIRQGTLGPTNATTLATQFELALAYLKAAQYSNAVPHLEQIVAVQTQTLREDHPHRIGSQYRLADAYVRIQQYDSAIKLFQDILRVDDTMNYDTGHRIRHSLANVHAAAGQVDAAIAALEHIVRDSSSRQAVSLTLRNQLGRLYMESSRPEKTIEILSPVAKEHSLVSDRPTEAQLAARHTLAYAYISSGRVKDALEIATEVVEKDFAADHERYSWRYLYALCLHLDGRSKEATSELKEWVEAPPSDATASKDLFYNAQVLLKQMQQIEAGNAEQKANMETEAGQVPDGQDQES